MMPFVLFSYQNGGFSQGLEWDGTYLYESENRLGTDIINKMDLSLLLETGSSTEATLSEFGAPGSMVEDLAWDGKSFFTSDERAFRLYMGELQ